uniref:Uncharacterized protein n=1 Tax=Rhizophora mucronata TaxID=61149 RepID=A0A2P2NMA0_RHIMU
MQVTNLNTKIFDICGKLRTICDQSQPNQFNNHTIYPQLVVCYLPM